MTAHDWMVLATGLVFLGAGAVLSQVFRLLGQMERKVLY